MIATPVVKLTVAIAAEINLAEAVSIVIEMRTVVYVLDVVR